MSYEIQGKLIVVYPIVQRSETFKTREFVIEKTEDIGGRIITNFVKFQCVQDKTSIVDRVNVNDTVKVLFNIKGTKWNKSGTDNYITNLDAWRIETAQLGSSITEPANYVAAPPPPVMNNDVDDLPF
jgi:Domain of unknown function (DUF3127)